MLGMVGVFLEELFNLYFFFALLSVAKIKNITVENCSVPDAHNLKNSGSSK